MVFYTEIVKSLLGECAKYLAVLLFTVLAIRLWRQAASVSKEKTKWIVTACLMTGAACGAGYFSLMHSLGRLYLHYGIEALNANRVGPAFVLFQRSLEFWKNPDAVGREGVCLLWSGQPDRGLELLGQAKALRSGEESAFEQFYEGAYWLNAAQPDRAIPLLQASSGDPTLQWNAILMLTVAELDRNRVESAKRIMQPFLKLEIEKGEHAYVMASLALLDGKKAEAREIIRKYAPTNPTPFWEARFEKLQAKVKD